MAAIDLQEQHEYLRELTLEPRALNPERTIADEQMSEFVRRWLGGEVE